MLRRLIHQTSNLPIKNPAQARLLPPSLLQQQQLEGLPVKITGRVMQVLFGVIWNESLLAHLNEGKLLQCLTLRQNSKTQY